MTSTNKNAGRQPGADITEPFTSNYTPSNLDLLNSALDLAGEQALHNGRVCGAGARLLASQLLNNIEWAKGILAAAANAETQRAAAKLHHALNLAADSALDADDAITRNDVDGLNRAISALALNAGIAQALALAWSAAP